MTDSKHYTDIAEAIRAKNGETTQYTPAEMADKIREISGTEPLVITNDNLPCIFSFGNEKLYKPNLTVQPNSGSVLSLPWDKAPFRETKGIYDIDLSFLEPFEANFSSTSNSLSIMYNCANVRYIHDLNMPNNQSVLTLYSRASGYGNYSVESIKNINLGFNATSASSAMYMFLDSSSNPQNIETEVENVTIQAKRTNVSFTALVGFDGYFKSFKNVTLLLPGAKYYINNKQTNSMAGIKFENTKIKLANSPGTTDAYTIPQMILNAGVSDVSDPNALQLVNASGSPLGKFRAAFDAKSTYEYGTRGGIFSGFYHPSFNDWAQNFIDNIVSILSVSNMAAVTYGDNGGNGIFNRCNIKALYNFPLWNGLQGYFIPVMGGNMAHFTFRPVQEGQVLPDVAISYRLHCMMGYGAPSSYGMNETYNYMYQCNSVFSDADYQRCKDGDYVTSQVGYSRYNRLSAIETLESLPDCSGHTKVKTIMFKGGEGKLTDGGAINTMTAEEIAIATAKGWTVTFMN